MFINNSQQPNNINKQIIGDEEMSKKALRHKYLDIRQELNSEVIENISKKITRNFFSLKEVNIPSCKNFLLFHSFRNEIITYDIINRLILEGKKVFLPYVKKERNTLGISRIYSLSGDELVSGVFGVKEPIQKQDIPVTEMDIMVVPGLVFARNGYRIGYGGGFYDRLLSKINNETLTVGLVYHQFLLDTLPVKDYDLPVDIVITEKEIVR